QMEENLDIDLIIKLVVPVVTAILGVLIKNHLDAKPKLITYLVNASAIPLKDDANTNVHVHSIVVRNVGKKSANNVRIGHTHLPKSYVVYPPLNHTVEEDAQGCSELIIPNLVPDEQVTIQYLYYPPITWDRINTYTKSDEMQAKYVNVIPSPQIPMVQQITMLVLMFIGASTTLYWLVQVFLKFA
ncbi:hypothetical protein ACVTOL_004783, partial [Vibrio parahaemolyticus]